MNCATDAAITAALSNQRYEPLPSLDQLPGWLWRRTGTGTRIAVLIALVAAIAAAALLIPELRAEQRQRAAADARHAAAVHAQEVRELKREQRPRYGRSAASRRTLMVRDLETAIAADARRRGLEGPILRGSCEPFPRTVGEPPPERDPKRTSGSYSCVAVTSEIERTAANAGGVLGHLYRASLDFRTGRYALCKVAGRPDPIPDPEVTTPAPCAGAS